MEKFEINRLLHETSQATASSERYQQAEQLEKQKHIREVTEKRSDTLALAKEASKALASHNIPKDMYIEASKPRGPSFIGSKKTERIHEGWCVGLKEWGELYSDATGGAYSSYYKGYLLLPTGQLYGFGSSDGNNIYGTKKPDWLIVRTDGWQEREPFVEQISNPPTLDRGKPFDGDSYFAEKLIQKDTEIQNFIAQTLVSRNITQI